jgi:hypothetical protein
VMTTTADNGASRAMRLPCQTRPGTKWFMS